MMAKAETKEGRIETLQITKTNLILYNRGDTKHPNRSNEGPIKPPPLRIFMMTEWSLQAKAKECQVTSSIFEMRRDSMLKKN